MRTINYTLLLLAFLSPIAEGQSKGVVPSAAQMAMANTGKPIPVIRCANKDTLEACKSLKELIDARDKRLLREIMGDPGDKSKQVSYVCLRPGDDFFQVVTLDIPQQQTYTPPLSVQISSYSRITDPKLREPLESATRQEYELVAKDVFADFQSPPLVSAFTKEKWLSDHSKSLVYGPGFVIVFRYQDGLEMGPISEAGEWSKPARPNAAKDDDSTGWFTGGYAWLERFNLDHGGVSAGDDNPERGHITADDSAIHIHYRYKNAANSDVDYQVLVNRSTGRFAETFDSSTGSSHDSGTCMIFK